MIRARALHLVVLVLAACSDLNQEECRSMREGVALADACRRDLSCRLTVNDLDNEHYRRARLARECQGQP